MSGDRSLPTEFIDETVAVSFAATASFTEAIKDGTTEEEADLAERLRTAWRAYVDLSRQVRVALEKRAGHAHD